MKPARRPGLTLYELIVVLAILVALAAVVIPMLIQTTNSVQLDTTYATMTNLRNAIMGTGTQSGYYQDMKGVALSSSHPFHSDPNATAGLPFLLCDLFVNPTTTTTYSVNSSGSNPPYVPATTDFTSSFDPRARKGWRGPYLNLPANDNTSIGMILDSFPNNGAPGSPILLQYPSAASRASDPNGVYKWRLISVGADSMLATNPDAAWIPAQLTPAIYKHDLIVYLRADPDSTNVNGTTNLQGTVWTNYYDLKNNNAGP